MFFCDVFLSSVFVCQKKLLADVSALRICSAGGNVINIMNVNDVGYNDLVLRG